MTVFIRFTPTEIATEIHKAKDLVVYSAPGVTDEVASALINTARRLGDQKVVVILDHSEHSLRCGYGTAAAMKMLIEENLINFRDGSDLRISLLVTDSKGWIFNQPPMVVESQWLTETSFNAISMVPQQFREVVKAINPYHGGLEHADSEYKTVEYSDYIPEIGIGSIDETTVVETIDRIEKNPPKPFDLDRMVRVYQTKIEFVEFSLIGVKIQQHRIKIHSDLLDLLTNAQKDGTRFNANYQIIDIDSDISGGLVDETAKDLRKHYLRTLSGIGIVILKENRIAFDNEVKLLEKEVELFKDSVSDKLDSEMEINLEKLVPLFSRLVLEQKPKWVCGSLGLDFSESSASSLVRRKLKSASPSAKKLVSGMLVKCLFKDVTLDMLESKDFSKKIHEAFPDAPWSNLLKHLRQQKQSTTHQRLYSTIIYDEVPASYRRIQSYLHYLRTKKHIYQRFNPTLYCGVKIIL
jgi:hypothetical protein